MNIEQFSYAVRYHLVDMIATLGFGHLGGALSVLDCISVLYAPKDGLLKIDPQNPSWNERDYFVLSKGHAGAVLYAALAVRGYFDTKELHTLNKPHTHLPSHVDRLKTPGVDMTAGSLGQGFGAAVGIALGARLNQKGQYVYCIVGDGELNEGQCWEAVQVAAHQKLNNLIIFVDDNKKQLDGLACDVCEPFDFAEKFRAFGWDAETIDGHDQNLIRETIVKAHTHNKPTAIILDTVKGKGIVELENSIEHHIRIDTEDKKEFIEHARKFFAKQSKIESQE